MSINAAWLPKREPLIIATVLFLCTVFLFKFHALERFELLSYDARFSVKDLPAEYEDIVIIEIAEDSIEKIGRWPWERDWHATLLSILNEYGAKMVGMDIIFSEPSAPEKDDAFLGAIHEGGNIFLPSVIDNYKTASISEHRLIEPIEKFRAAISGTGHINVLADTDGVIRRIPAFIPYKDGNIPHIAMSMAMQLLDISPDEVEIKSESIHLGRGEKKLKIPTDEDGNILLNWSGTWTETFKHVSYVDIIQSYAAIQQGKEPLIDLGLFKDKICFIGGTAIGLADIRPISLQTNYPAVGVNMTFLSNMLDRDYMRPLSSRWGLAILCLVFILMLFIIKIENYFRSAALIIALAVAYACLATFLFAKFDIWMNFTYPVFFIVTTYIVVTLFNHFKVVAEKKRLFIMATRDELTGLTNIGHFKQLFAAELKSFRLRPERKLAVILSDIDNFKKVNDTYGHLAGDLVLKEAGKVLSTSCRGLDVPARYGGEELVVMLPGANAAEAAKVAEKIRIAMSEKSFPAEVTTKEGKQFAYYKEKKEFQVTLSLGVAEVTMLDTEMDHVISRADKALYEAKETGKNKVVVAPTPSAPAKER